MFEKEIYDKLTHYCSYQERCTADVNKKLFALKVPRAEYDPYIAKLKTENFLNEDRYVRSFVSVYSGKKKWGKNKIKSALQTRGVSASLVKKYLDEIEEADYNEQVKLLAEKKWKSIRTGTPKERKAKLMRFLLSKGFEMDKIIPVIKAVQV